MFSDDHWGHRTVSSVMDIFDEDAMIVKARPEGCPKLFTFYKRDIRPIGENEIENLLSKMIMDAVDRRNDIFNRTFCIYIMSHNKNKLAEFSKQISEMVNNALHELRISGERRR
jgi:hypothetical protein